MQDVPAGERVPPEIDGVLTDLGRRASAPARTLGPALNEPMHPGHAIFYPRGTSGTAGCLVSATTASGKRTLYVLSNNHVIGATNTAGVGRLRFGEPHHVG